MFCVCQLWSKYLSWARRLTGCSFKGLGRSSRWRGLHPGHLRTNNNSVKCRLMTLWTLFNRNNIYLRNRWTAGGRRFTQTTGKPDWRGSNQLLTHENKHVKLHKSQWTHCMFCVRLCLLCQRVTYIGHWSLGAGRWSICGPGPRNRAGGGIVLQCRRDSLAGGDPTSCW